MMKKFLYKLAKGNSRNEDISRRAFILNVLLLCSITLSFLAVLKTTLDLVIRGSNYKGAPPSYAIFLLLIFLFLFFLSKRGYPLIASHLLVLLYLIPLVFGSYIWGVDMPQGLLTYALIITMSGVLVGTRYAIVQTLTIMAIILLLGYLQIESVNLPDYYWKNSIFRISDLIVFDITFFVIMIISWLSNREIEKSLLRARQSEIELKKERDLLEFRVEERTKELKQAQIEQMSQLVHFAEFGKIASGIFHDLVNPLTAISLNLEKIRQENVFDDTKSHLEQAISATKRMESLMAATKKQVQRQEEKCYFSPAEEVEEIIQILSHKARKAKVTLTFRSSDSEPIFGNPLKFHQIITNLATNAIDSYDQITLPNNRDVIITLENKKDKVLIKVRDYGTGIAKESIKKIFDPFFTTKTPTKGMGMGLAVVKDIVESYFNGSITVETALGKGSTFNIEIPKIIYNGKENTKDNRPCNQTGNKTAKPVAED